MINYSCDETERFLKEERQTRRSSANVSARHSKLNECLAIDDAIDECVGNIELAVSRYESKVYQAVIVYSSDVTGDGMVPVGIQKTLAGRVEVICINTHAAPLAIVKLSMKEACQRFDYEKSEYPTPESRVQLLEFYFNLYPTAGCSARSTTSKLNTVLPSLDINNDNHGSFTDGELRDEVQAKEKRIKLLEKNESVSVAKSTAQLKSIEKSKIAHKALEKELVKYRNAEVTNKKTVVALEKDNKELALVTNEFLTENGKLKRVVDELSVTVKKQKKEIEEKSKLTVSAELTVPAVMQSIPVSSTSGVGGAMNFNGNITNQIVIGAGSVFAAGSFAGMFTNK